MEILVEYVLEKVFDKQLEKYYKYVALKNKEKLSKKLKNEIDQKITKYYGDEIHYDTVQKYIMRNKIIESMIQEAIQPDSTNSLSSIIEKSIKDADLLPQEKIILRDVLNLIYNFINSNLFIENVELNYSLTKLKNFFDKKINSNDVNFSELINNQTTQLIKEISAINDKVTSEVDILNNAYHVYSLVIRQYKKNIKNAYSYEDYDGRTLEMSDKFCLDSRAFIIEQPEQKQNTKEYHFTGLSSNNIRTVYKEIEKYKPNHYLSDLEKAIDFLMDDKMYNDVVHGYILIPIDHEDQKNNYLKNKDLDGFINPDELIYDSHNQIPIKNPESDHFYDCYYKKFLKFATEKLDILEKKIKEGTVK